MPHRNSLLGFAHYRKGYTVENTETDNNAIENARRLLAAVKAMRAAYGTFYRGNCYITVSYEAQLAEVNRIADEAIAAAESSGVNS